MSEDEGEAVRLYHLLRGPQIEQRCRATELQLEIAQQLERAEHGSSAELEQRHAGERMEVAENIRLYRSDHDNTVLALELGPDVAVMHGLDCYPPPLDPDYEKLMGNLAARQFDEAAAFKAKVDRATENGPPPSAALMELKEEFRALYVGFHEERNRYADEYALSQRLARDWQGLEQGLQDRDKFTR